MGGWYWSASLSFVAKYKRAAVCLGCEYLEEHNYYLKS